MAYVCPFVFFFVYVCVCWGDLSNRRFFFVGARDRCGAPGPAPGVGAAGGDERERAERGRSRRQHAVEGAQGGDQHEPGAQLPGDEVQHAVELPDQFDVYRVAEVLGGADRG